MTWEEMSPWWQIVVLGAVIWYFSNKSAEKKAADQARQRNSRRTGYRHSQASADPNHTNRPTTRPAGVALSDLGIASQTESSDDFDPHIQVLHFTQFANLDGISRRGLLLRAQLSLVNGAQFAVNDLNRIDERIFSEGGVCLSLGHPNAGLLFRFRQAQDGREYVILELNSRILMERENYLVCPTNAASNEVWMLHNNAPHSLKATGALQELFARKILRSGSEVYHRPLALPTWYTTDPQAELLYLRNIPRSTIVRIHCAEARVQKRIEDFVTSCNWDVDVRASAELFQSRSDSAEWKNSRTEPNDFRNRVEKHRG
jgi:hypothetical protein